MVWVRAWIWVGILVWDWVLSGSGSRSVSGTEKGPELGVGLGIDQWQDGLKIHIIISKGRQSLSERISHVTNV